jgi:anti-anti-sigma regulatory factor
MGSSEKKPTVTEAVIHVTREGDWLPPAELRTIALKAVDAEGDLTVDLQGVDHLDASALQILLALARERKLQGRTVILADASSSLAHWFEYAGGRENISHEREA